MPPLPISGVFFYNKIEHTFAKGDYNELLRRQNTEIIYD